jgi:hypothetical protein
MEARSQALESTLSQALAEASLMRGSLAHLRDCMAESQSARTAPVRASPSQTGSAECLAEIAGAEAAGWRLYTDPETRIEVFVNDSTYEEAGTLKKVQSLLEESREREVRGV